MARMWSPWISNGTWVAGREASGVREDAHDLARIANDPEVSVEDLARAVAAEPVLAVTVLRIANAAMTESRILTTDVTEAVVRLGTTSVRDVLTLCLRARTADQAAYGRIGDLILEHRFTAAMAEVRPKRHQHTREVSVFGLQRLDEAAAPSDSGGGGDPRAPDLFHTARSIFGRRV